MAGEFATADWPGLRVDVVDGGTHVRLWGRSVWRMCLLLCAAALCLFLVLPASVSQEAAKLCFSNKTAKVLMVNLTDLNFPAIFINSFHAGFNAALTLRNNTVAGGVRVEMVEKNSTVEEYESTLEETLKNDQNILVLARHFGDRELNVIIPTLERHNAVAFAPATGSSSVRGWNPNVYFLIPEPAAELLALIHYAMHNLRVHRLGFMYLKNINFGDREYEHAKRVMSDLGYELSGVFTIGSSFFNPADDAIFNASWERFADTRPQAVIVFGSPIHDTATFISRMFTDQRTASAYILAPSATQMLILHVWGVVVFKGVKFRAGQVITTSSIPLAKETKYRAVRRFQDVMRKYLKKNHSWLEGVIGHNFSNNKNVGDMMFTGWLAAEVLLQALDNPVWLTSRVAFQQSLFNQRRYVVDDLVFGDFGNECTEDVANNGAACRCNQGGRTVYMQTFVEGFQAENIEESRMTLRTSDCDSSLLSIAPVFYAMGVYFNEDPLWLRIGLQLVSGISAAKANIPVQEGRGLYVHGINSTMERGRDDLLAETTERRVHGVVGIVTEAMLDVSSVVFIDPLQHEPRLNRFRRHVLHLSPTLQQQFFVLAQYLGDTNDASAHAIVRGGDGAVVADALRLSLVSFGGSLLSTTLLAVDDALEGSLPQEGNVFIAGLHADDVGVVARHVAVHSSVRVFVTFLDLALLYDEFVGAFASGEGVDRVVFATSLPHWADTHTTSKTAQKFLAVQQTAVKRTPLSLLGFASTLLVQNIISRIEKVNSELFVDFFYRHVVVSVDDMVYGLFSGNNACADGSTRCSTNYGATSIAVWSLARALNSSVPPLAAPVTPTMDYRDPNAGQLTLGHIIGIIVGVVLVVLLLTVVVVYCCRDLRDNRNAPKERTDPVTLVFTDIESSTALWAACPKEMSDAVAAHHRLVRSLIGRYGCYEVKTVGDSFMIACRGPFSAVQLVRDLQQVFMRHNWNTTAFDDAYREFENMRAAENGETEGENAERGNGEYVPPTARLDADVYRRHWNGLRVRVGVHTGVCDIRYDPVTKGYDYYGSTSNTAARTESIANGGQVLLTRAAYMALSTTERAQVNVTALGPVALRGVPLPVEMYQLNAVPGRTFAALRLERGINDLEICAENDFFSASSASHTELSHAAENSFYHMMSDLFSPLSLFQRRKVLEALCERWGVSVFFKGDKTTDACNAAILRLAAKLARVCGQRKETSVSGLFSVVTTPPAASPYSDVSQFSEHLREQGIFIRCRDSTATKTEVDESTASHSGTILCYFSSSAPRRH